MKLKNIKIHNFRSIIEADIDAYDYMLLVGANNAGKSTVLNALRAFYDDAKWTSNDLPKKGESDEESWVQLTFELSDDEWEGLADKYKEDSVNKYLIVRRYFKSADKNRVKANQSNIYGIINGETEEDLFYGAKNVSTAKVGQVLYIPALTMPAEQTKMSGPSPLRNMLNFLLKKVVAKSEAYKGIAEAFDKLNSEARETKGFLSEVSSPLNDAISIWDIKIDLSLNTIAPEDISKSLIKCVFVDSSLGDIGFDLDRYGHGFQRSVIYELIRLAPNFKEEKNVNKKDFNPTFNLILFEEPEAFLHPSQQENMAYHLRRLASEEDNQVIITTHSPVFAGKGVENIGRLVRIQRVDGVTKSFQPHTTQINKLFEQGGKLVSALENFVNDEKVPDCKKSRARKILKNPPSADIALQEERFRFQLWLDSERANLFFANKVLLVEGPTERALFNYLLANDWHDLCHHHICVVDVLGKYNFHRYMALLELYGISHGVMLDDDQTSRDAEFHGAVNDFVESSANSYTIKNIVKFTECLERFLELEVPYPPRNDKKPVEIMKAITENRISSDKLGELREKFCEALDITPLPNNSSSG